LIAEREKAMQMLAKVEADRVERKRQEIQKKKDLMAEKLAEAVK
jgi:hypothetical protein